LEKWKLCWRLPGIHPSKTQASRSGNPRDVFVSHPQSKPRAALNMAKQLKSKRAPETKASEPSQVNAYMKQLKHPLTDVVAALRQIILKADPEIGEEIKWNAPTFFFTGELLPSDPKLYKRYLVIFNLFKKDSIRLVFWNGAAADDKSGFLQGDYSDGRRLASFHDLAEASCRQKQLEDVLRKQLASLKQ
jgi:hypothetical protein